MELLRKHQRATQFILVLLILATVLAACSLGKSSKPSRTNTKLFDGVTYIREVRSDPRDMVIHIVKINVALGGIRPIVTAPDNPKSDKPYNARTTSQFLKSTGVQLAINGGGFHPWYDFGIIYSPHVGDPVAPMGTTISGDFTFEFQETQKRPMLEFGGSRPVDIGWVAGSPEYAVSGTRLLVDNAAILDGLDDSKADPRTAAGVSEDGQHLIIVVVDGRQFGYSQGATLKELAQILVDNGAYRALELDGGGSSTLVIEGDDGQPVLLNSPSHRGINGKERPVATHIGFYIQH